MKKYFSLLRIRYVNDLQYRAAAAAGIATQFAWGFMYVLLFVAFRNEGAERFPMEFSATVSYLWLRQAFLCLFMFWGFDSDILNCIRTGMVSIELVRPMSVYWRWFTQTIGARLAKMSLRAPIVLLISLLLPAPYGLSLPTSIGALALFLLTTVLSGMVVTATIMFIYLLTFYTLVPDGTTTVFSGVVEFLSGGVIPLPFYPDGLYRVLKYLPFASMENVPFRIYTGDLAGGEALEAILLQCFWLIVLLTAGQLWMKHALRRTVAQGG